jgi:hypothetical protein
VELAMRKLGLVMMIASFLPWLAIFLIVPFLSLSGFHKALLVTALIISGEILFWLSVLLVGNVVFQQYRRYFNPRFLRIQLQKIWRWRK